MVARLVCDLGLFYGLRSQLRLLSPHSEGGINPALKKETGPTQECAQRVCILSTNSECVSVPSMHGTSSQRLGTFKTPERFDYPVDRKRTQVTTYVTQTLEQNLDTLWGNTTIMSCRISQAPHISAERNAGTAFKARTKVKTRGEAEVLDTEANEAKEPDKTPSTNATPMLLFKKRAANVFSTLFYRASRGQQPGEIP
ncbi:uncharacterized protein CC84DRAFT_1167975 [Paraphaeosphaeria sporulosa]|uniref:Uncharacterized protein n=1 Tax=Paraphaeosphaeria sporulosa TaxID=1460663 RepID=A0A177C2Z1_9PLEO|nr:uncharacterized protein CC84DRAFT_1167975 [Paraphaeosphaeria sporulosa]OAG01835.1 hypothetical protein CC84DRAFT_1167975 [Paraphaeosphaeria sporulosa]